MSPTPPPPFTRVFPSVFAARRSLPWVVAGSSLIAVAGEPFTWYRRVWVGLPALAVLAIAGRRGLRPWPRGSPPAGGPVAWSGTPARLGAAVWFVLLGITAAFQLANFTRGPRARYPTFSSLMNIAFEAYPARVAAFAAWLALGAYLVRRA